MKYAAVAMAVLLTLGTSFVQVGAEELAGPTIQNLPVSQIVVPVTVDLDQAQAWLADAVTRVGPQSHSEEKCVGGDAGKLLGSMSPCIDVEVTATVVPGSVTLTAVPDGVAVSVLLGVQGTAGGDAVELTAGGQLHVQGTFRPKVQRDWSVEANVSLEHHWPNKPDLEIHGIHLGTVTSIADKAVNKAKAKAIAQAIEQLQQSSGLRGIAERAWLALSTSHDIGGGVWLQFHPTGIGVGAVTGEGRTLTLPLAVEGRAGLSLSEPSAEAPQPLPPPIEPPSSVSSRLSLTAEATFAQVEQLLANVVPSAALEVPFAGQVLPVTVSNWKVRSDAGSLFVGAEVSPTAATSAPFKAWVWLGAQPTFDAAGQQLRFSGLTVAPETNAALTPLAMLLAAGVENDLRVDVGAQIAEVVTRIPQPAEVSIALGGSQGETLTLRLQDLAPKLDSVVVSAETLFAVMTLHATVTGHLKFDLPATTGPAFVNPPFGNTNPYGSGQAGGVPPPIFPSGRYAGAPGERPPPVFTVPPPPPRPPDLGRLVSNCACLSERIGMVVTLGPRTCASSRAIAVACGPPCYGGHCPTPMCPDGQPIRQRQCTF